VEPELKADRGSGVDAPVTVSVIVPTFNRRASLERLLEGLARQTYPVEAIEVVVVDDGSTDGTREWLDAARFPYRLRPFSQNHGGPAEARNRGVAEATGELLVFLDDDVLPDARVIESHVTSHRDRDTVVIGPMLPPTDWSRPAWIRWEEDKLVAVYDAMASGRWPCTPRQFFTANASLPRDRFRQSGGFDTRFRRAEDVELGYRLSDAGMRFVFEPIARVWHYPVRSFASWQRTPYDYGRADVWMQRDKGHQALSVAYDEFREKRHPLTRALARICVAVPVAFGPVCVALRMAVYAAEAMRLHSLASAALSALYNTLYWQGVSDAVAEGDAARLSNLDSLGALPRSH
jgi:GT2 family glycosyltransferase